MLITRGDATARAALVICSSPILQVSDAGEAIIIHCDSLGFEERRPGVSPARKSRMHWNQVYDPLGHWWLSTLIAALPIFVLLGMLAGLKVKPHWCAIAGAFTAIVVAM